MRIPVATKAQQEAMKLYAEVMEETKTRLQWVEDALNGRNGFHGQLIREVCYLQFRLICELIALGCLVAHGDVTAKTKLEDEYAADKITTLLFKLHPDFYPIPHGFVQLGPGRHHFTEITEPYLTREQLKLLYVKTGDVLHKGKLKKWIANRSPGLNDYAEIEAWRRKIIRLLAIHRLPMVDGNRQVMCFLTDSTTGKVLVSSAERFDG